MELTQDQIIAIALVVSLLLIAGLRGMLNLSGLLAAAIVGLSVSLLGHWTWLAILMVFLMTGSIATNWRYEEKKALHLAEDNEGTRGWRNVMANGAVASLVSVLNFALGGPEWAYLAASASIAVASSDTLASEIGSLDPRTRSILNLEAVPAGTNGGMSVTGTFAAFFGGLLIAVMATTLYSIHGGTIPLISLMMFITVIGWLGCQVDSILGALLENEGYIGKHTVNFLATLSGALMAYLAYWRFL
ncbi:MAG TPA: DUF92 domain-containing protein [Candidatus Poseidoniales archaeon]|nr:DUF92 domain-containing protein [Candidatus Poseidoniales archaeon]